MICSLGANAQLSSYTATFSQDAGHPGPQNTDTYTNETGWTLVIPGSQATNTWSPVQTLPFAFDFFGTAVTQYKVSGNGLVTFDVGTSLLPNVNYNLPTPFLPNNTIAGFWDAFAVPTGSNDEVRVKTFGTAPNRQLWIKYFSYLYGDPDNAFSYFAIVLEEGTNKVYVVDEWAGTSPLTSTVGVQLNPSFAVQYGDSTITTPQGLDATTTPSDDYYTFLPLSLAANDVGISAINSPSQSTTPTLQNVSVTVTNFGTTTIDSAIIQWTINGVAQPDFNFIGTLAAGASSAPVTIGTITPANGDVITAWTTLPNGTADGQISNDTTSLSLCFGLVGTNFTINSAVATGGLNFQTFADAIDTLTHCGVAGPVAFTVAAGTTYTAQVVLPAVQGASSTNTITFNGNGATLQFNAVTAARYILKFNGGDHYIIDSLNIRSTNATYGIGILMSGGADSNIIRRCNIDVSAVTSTSSTNSAGVAFSNADNSTSTAGNNGNYNLFQNNNIRGGYYGVSVYGVASSFAGSAGNRFVGNIVREFYSHGFHINDNTGTVISGNNIHRQTRTTTATTMYGINLPGGVKNALIEKNRIHNTHTAATTKTGTVYGINFDANDAPVGEENKVINNAIYKIDNFGPIYALRNDGSNGVHYYHNTVALTDTVTSTSVTKAFWQDVTATDIIVKNNIFSITRNGGTTGEKTVFHVDDATTFVESDNNVYYLNATGGAQDIFLWGTLETNSLATWQQNTFQDSNSVIVNPQFVNTATGDLTPQQSMVNNLGEFVGVTDDILGNPRSTTMPDPGAFEFTGPANDAAVVVLNSPSRVTTATSQNVDATIFNYGSDTLNTVTIVWALNGVPQDTVVFTGNVLPRDSAGPITLGTITPAAGDVITVWTSQPNGSADANTSNDTLTVNLCLGLAGNYTISADSVTAGRNYASWGAAISAMTSCGISGPVVFDIVAGTGPYGEQPVIPAIVGASSINTITFRGHGDSLYFAPPNGSMFIIHLNGADHVILDSLLIVTLGNTNGVGVLFGNGADSNIVRNSVIDLRSTLAATTTLSGGFVGSTSTSSSTTAGNIGDGNLFENNLVMGGYYGVRISGVTGSFTTENNIIRNNTFRDNYLYGIYLDDVNSTVVSGNDISRPTRANITTGTTYGISLNGVSMGNLIEKNSYHDTHDSSMAATGIAYGISISSVDADTGRENRIINNEIYDVNSDGTIYGIHNAGSNGVQIYHNTISLDNPLATSTSANFTRGFFQTTAATNIDFRNNIISITRGGSSIKHALYFGTATSDIISDYNVLYVNSSGLGTQFIGHFDTTDAVTLADWQAVGFDSNSVSANPLFVDVANGDLHPSSPLVNNIGDSLGVADDITGASRPLNNPDPGAYEFSPLPDDVAVENLVNPTAPLVAGISSVEVTVRNTGGTTLTSVDVYVAISDGTTTDTLGPVTYTDTLASGALSDTINMGNYNFTGGTYTITVWTTDPNGFPDVNTANDTLVVTLCTALAGPYSIDSTGTGNRNFLSFNDAVAALQSCGISAPVYFTVASDTFNEQVTLLPVAGSSAINTITFDGVNMDSVRLVHDGTTKWATLLLKGVDYVTLTNMTIETTPLTKGWAVQLMDGADHNTVTNNKLIGHPNSVTDVAGFLISGSEINDATDGNSNYATVSNNIITGGEYGIELQGATATPLKGIVISGNTITAANDYGIYVDDQDSIIITGNTVRGLRATGADAVYLLDMKWYFEVTGNNIDSRDYGLYISNGNSDAASVGRSKVHNNMVHSPLGYGVYLTGTDSTDFFHNSIWAERGLYLEACVGLDVRNNIITSTEDYAFYDNDAATTSGYVGLDYNVYLRRDGGALAFFPTARVDLAAWRTAFPQFNQNSLQGDPEFVDSTDLHITGLLANDQGDNGVGVTVDFDGDVRPLAPSATVDIGADEYQPADNDVMVIAFVTPTGNICGDSSDVVQVAVYNNGFLTQTNIPVTVIMSGSANDTISGVLAGPLASGETDTVTVGTVNTTTGGFLTFTGFTQLATEQNLSNDTLVAIISFDSIPFVPVTIGDTVCAGTSATLEVTSQGTSFRWYNAPNGGNAITVGDTFITAPLDTTTTYYVEGYSAVLDSVGIKTAGTSSFLTQTKGYGLFFTVNEEIIIKAVHVYPTGTGTITMMVLQPGTNDTLFIRRPENISGNGSQKVAVPVNFTLQPGTYKMAMSSTGITNLKRETANVTYPYATDNNEVVITAGATGATGTSASTYYWFYDWVIEMPGCVSPVRTAVTAVVNNPIALAGADQQICAGDSATLTAQNGQTWMWSTGETTQSVTVSPATSTNYVLTITDAMGCTGVSDTVRVVVNQLPIADAGAGDTVCAGATVTLTATGGGTYQWSNGATTASTQVTPVVPTTYTVTVTSTNGCTATDSVRVDFYLPAAGFLGADTAICMGDSITLTAGAGNVTWSTGDTTSTITVSPTSLTTYSVFITDNNGCTASDTIAVDVNALPVAGASTDTSVCSGEMVTLTATGGTSYMWSNGDNTASTTFAATATNTYTVTVTNASGCTDTEDVTVAVDLLPVVNLGADTAICAGQSVMLTASGGGVYSWSTGASTQSITVSPTTDTEYSVEVMNASGCIASDTITVTVNTPAALNFSVPDSICMDSTLALTATPSGGFFAGTGVGGNVFDPAGLAEGMYIITYEYTDANGCSASTGDSIFVDDCITGIADADFAENISVYPNPFQDRIVIDVEMLNGAEVTVRLTDLVGKTIISERHVLNAGNNTIRLYPGSEIASGMYMLELRNGDKLQTFRLLRAQ